MRYKKYLFPIEKESIGTDIFFKRYHFEETDRELLDATGRFLTEMITVEAGMIYQEEKVVCVVTLGSLFDRLSELVAESGHLLLAYSMECFGMELLSKAYEKMNELVYQETGRWMGEYHFLGQENPGEIQQSLAAFPNLAIAWEKGMLYPLKSVIFTAEYKEKREQSGCHSCEQCDNVTCSFRKVIKEQGRRKRMIDQGKINGSAYSYGVSRIFGGTGL